MDYHLETLRHAKGIFRVSAIVDDSLSSKGCAQATRVEARIACHDMQLYS
jgi:hypothetical protein